MTSPVPRRHDTVPATTDPTGRPVLRRRASTHGQAMARMRAALASERQPLAVRALARHPADEPAIALLDTWAVVADIVAFYTERIAQEGYLGTATELRSLQQLARCLGHEPRPGVSAEAELAFNVEDTPGAPPVVVVPSGMPVQSIPGQDELPQTFETGAELEARAVWNAVPAVDRDPQRPSFGRSQLWLAGATTDVRPGDGILFVDEELTAPDAGEERGWDFRVAAAVDPEPERQAGWTRLTLAPGGRPGQGPVPGRNVRVHRFSERAYLFGWNAPPTSGAPSPTQQERAAAPRDPSGDTEGGVIELDGDNARVLPGSWLLLEAGSNRAVFRVVTATPSGGEYRGVSGRITRVLLDSPLDPTVFDRRTTLVHCVPVQLPAGHAPRTDPVRGGTLVLDATVPPLPPGRLVLVQGTDMDDGTERAERATVVTCTPDAAGSSMSVTLDRELEHRYAPVSVRLRGNVVTATHGETVTQVLGSGDGRGTFSRLGTRRGPLSYVRAATSEGAVGTLRIRVDGAEWREIDSLEEAGPHDRVFTVRILEDGTAQAVFGDGVHGARLPTGTENVTAVYRVGTGADGAMAAGQLSLLPQRPFGIRDVTNPIAAHDWAPRELPEDVRRNAPLRVRTLDRVVSVRDHEDFARGFAGVGTARADTVWDGRQRVVVVSLIGSDATAVGDGLLDALGDALAQARVRGTPLVLRRGEVLRFGVRVEVIVDPAYERAVVTDAVTAALARDFGAARRSFGAPVTATAVLLSVRAVPGVVACTMPDLLRPAAPPSPPGLAVAEQVLTAAPARWEDKAVRAAQLLDLDPGAVEVGVMAP
ncbi:hypothetical protein [Streptomyces sp. Caat 7-52]|uniref:hypothetical protein n=1 Tax=Streptomyces sp. Caat 7-52 TaxID=2949637 RepID=UPI002035F3C3|nr:hypothetical protein [Streptomyces sp. Caat 7-52]